MAPLATDYKKGPVQELSDREGLLMGKVIASTYEILQQIGSGGGGVVYLGRHLRLKKQIVLKAYKRTDSTKPATLSREVDALKNLSHTYIPQVYDYVEEDGTVYSVMEYIEGESLDKPLKRGERFSQPQVIAWACQLLEALCYLHSRPPYGILHSDIKPANRFQYRAGPGRKGRGPGGLQPGLRLAGALRDRLCAALRTGGFRRDATSYDGPEYPAAHQP